ncbi:WD40 repeat-like protein [Athelia psychrophila]|uniref:WD40 repeat-like protein n=1 Tax=Athelia psychrophila TaxID=1759441 RepID=A0A166ISJ0_9AGAM|nr:WD40 repeat-like protein [Fibularhizoctonia sp. CBS 109695]
MPQKDEEEEIPPPQRPPSPPLHTTFAARGVHAQNFPAFKPRDTRISAYQGMTHVSWSCDGKKLAAVGTDKATRVWLPEKSMEYRAATAFTGGHTDDVDYVSWNPTHPELFCTSSQKDRKIVFWDARQSKNTQAVSLGVSPTQTNYSPDGKSLLYTSAGHQLFFMTHGKENEVDKEQWNLAKKEGSIVASTAMFNHVGNGVIMTHHSEHTIRSLDYPSLIIRESPAAHVGGCVAVALDPRGRYLASGGYDSIVNMFDLSEWICARTITSCENAINALSFSHDGEYLAIANTGNYIDICATETGIPIHRVPASAPAPTVTWHPSKYVIAYCGQTKVKEGAPPPVALISLFGPL